jgi:hypothetical protein
MKTIDSIVAAVAVDERDRLEGICAALIGDQWMPLIAADEERYEQIKAAAEIVAMQTGKTVKMVRFAQRSVLETINLKGENNG